MSIRTRCTLIVTSILGLVAITASFALAQNAHQGSPPPPQLAPDVAEQMQACIEAGMPGEQHKVLARTVGVWRGQTQMYFDPGTEPARGTCTWTVTSIYDGRYIKTDLDAELSQMGAFTGIGYAGFDNVSQKFVGTWLDSHSTGIMNGTGEVTESGSTTTFTWRYNTNCAVTRKPIVVREVQTLTGPNSMTFEMFAPDPATGKEGKCMHVDLTRES
jgi:hypothetical protein